MKLEMCLYLVLIHRIVKMDSFSIDNDLYSHYETSEDFEVESTGETLFDNIDSLITIILRNVSQICPTNQPEHMQRVERIIRNTIKDIYENGKKVASKINFYGEVTASVNAILDRCMQSSRTISKSSISKIVYGEKIIHLDLMNHLVHPSKWQEFRSCVSTKGKSVFYSGSILSVIDTFWQSFLLGYFGCKEFYRSSLDAWQYLDVVQNVILFPLTHHWKSIFPTKPLISVDIQRSSKSSDIDADILLMSNSPTETISSKLEKCNVVLFLKYPVDPIPCFNMFEIFNSTNL